MIARTKSGKNGVKNVPTEEECIEQPLLVFLMEQVER